MIVDFTPRKERRKQVLCVSVCMCACMCVCARRDLERKINNKKFFLHVPEISTYKGYDVVESQWVYTK